MKPDAITIISRENFREAAWPLPAGDLLYVGPATKRKLYGRGIHTIGELAGTDPANLRAIFGKTGDVLYVFANGMDTTPVAHADDVTPIKSIGNSCTAPRDLTCDEDAKMLIYVLAESVAMRLREQGVCCKTVAISIRDNELMSFERQIKLRIPTDITSEIMGAALQLFRANWDWIRPIRSLGVRVTDFVHGSECVQLDLYGDEKKREKLESLDRTLDKLRSRFGNDCLQRAAILQDKSIASIDAKRDHIIHPIGYF